MNRYTVFGITILVGFLAAVYYGWAVRPVSVHDATPALLREDFRADYALMVAEAFMVDNDPERAISSLSFLAVEGEPYNPYEFVADALLFGTEEGYSLPDLAALQALEQGLREYDPSFSATPTP